MKMFFAQGRIRLYEYEGETSIVRDSRIVLAASEEEARDKYDKYWSGKTVEYSRYYSVYDVVMSETLE